MMNVIPEEARIDGVYHLQKVVRFKLIYVEEINTDHGALKPSQVRQVVLEDENVLHLLNNPLGRELLERGHVYYFDILV
jgi:hypothetical protein